MNDKDLVVLKFPDCGQEFQLSYGRYRRFKKDHVFRCGPCGNKYKSKTYSERYYSLSPEKKQEWAQKSVDAFKRKSPEEKALFAKKYLSV